MLGTNFRGSVEKQTNMRGVHAEFERQGRSKGMKGGINGKGVNMNTEMGCVTKFGAPKFH